MSCASKRCKWKHHKVAELLLHLLESHHDAFEEVAPNLAEHLYVDYYCEAVAVHERQHAPSVGMAIDRRVIRTVLSGYNDDYIKCLICFACAQRKHVQLQFMSVNKLANNYKCVQTLMPSNKSGRASTSAANG